jgi:SAM-dependent methyltransferase
VRPGSTTGNASPFASAVDRKPAEFYRGIRVKADLGLHEQVAAQVMALCADGGEVLDLGCGEGALSQRLADVGYRVLSVDVEEAVFRASTPFVRLDFNAQSSMDDFVSTHANRFDVVLGVEVIEHLQDPWRYLRNLTAMARPGGLILVTTPNVTSWYSRIRFLFTGRLHQFADSDRLYGHINPVAEDELRYIAASVGLDTLSIKPGGWLPKLWLAGEVRRVGANVLGFILRPLMRGTRDGWCLIAVMRKPG